LKGFYNFNKRVILASAEKMPAEHYGFKPTPEIRSYAELVAHVADRNYLTCAPAKGAPNPQKDIQHTEKTAKTSVDEAKALATEDPAIKAERLKLEILPWFGPKGIGVKAGWMIVEIHPWLVAKEVWP